MTKSRPTKYVKTSLWRHSGAFIVNFDQISHIFRCFYSYFEQVNTAWESFISIPHKMPEISWF